MDIVKYDFPSEIHFSRLVSQLARLEDGLARLDERISALPFGPGIAERLLYGEACACVNLQGFLVHREDLVLLDANAFDGAMSMELSEALKVLGIWRKALRTDADKLLQSDRPGEALSLEPEARNRDLSYWHGCTSEIIEKWRAVVRRTSTFPPLLAAAVACDAWLHYQRGSSATWRAGLLGALVLKARRKTQSFLLPFDTGRVRAGDEDHLEFGFIERVARQFDWIEAAMGLVRGEVQRLTLAEQMLRKRLDGRRKTSHLPQLVELFLRLPVVSVPMAAKVLRCSSQAVEQMIVELGSTPRLLTERKRYRVWGI